MKNIENLYEDINKLFVINIRYAENNELYDS